MKNKMILLKLIEHIDKIQGYCKNDSYESFSKNSQCRQDKHITHCSRTQTGLPFFISMAETGQLFSHNPQPTQVLSAEKCMQPEKTLRKHRA